MAGQNGHGVQNYFSCVAVLRLIKLLFVTKCSVCFLLFLDKRVLAPRMVHMHAMHFFNMSIYPTYIGSNVPRVYCI